MGSDLPCELQGWRRDPCAQQIDNHRQYEDMKPSWTVWSLGLRHTPEQTQRFNLDPAVERPSPGG
jgi:hypothetical protein